MLLIFLLGVWLWDNHLGSPMVTSHQEQTGTWQLALRKADRDLRLSDGTRDQPDWVRMLLGIQPLDQTLDQAIAALEPLVISRHRHGETPEAAAIADNGAYALAVLTAIRAGGNAASGPFASLGLPGPPPDEQIASRVIEGNDHWWDIAYLRACGRSDADQFASLSAARTSHLVGLAYKARGTVLALTIGGLVFVPTTLLAFLRARSRTIRPTYDSRWKLSFGLAVFLLAYLAFLGFSITFNQGLELIAARSDGGPLLTMPVYIALDSLTRFLPALIALGLLFRRPRHAISRLGLAGPLDGRLVLGGFALLQAVDFGLRVTLGPGGVPDPTGGLSEATSGPWGLILGVASACLAAPIAEEILYRGVLLRSLANRLPLWPALILSSAVFALVHIYTVPNLILVGTVGLICGLSYMSSRTLLTAIALHALYNASIRIPEWIVYQTPLS